MDNWIAEIALVIVILTGLAIADHYYTTYHSPYDLLHKHGEYIYCIERRPCQFD